MHAMCKSDSPMGWPSEHGYTTARDSTDLLIGVPSEKRGCHPERDPGGR